MSRWVIYVLNNKQHGCTYVGATVNPRRRLRQHNGELKGGAKYTRRGRGHWCYVCLVSGFRNQREALQFEWALHHCRGGIRRKKGRALYARVAALLCVMHRTKWVSKALPAAEIPLHVNWIQKPKRPIFYSHKHIILLRDLPFIHYFNGF